MILHNPQNILYIENGIGYGGAAISLRYFLSHLDNSRYRAFVITSGRDRNYQSFREVSNWSYMKAKMFDKNNLLQRIKSYPARTIGAKILSFLDYCFNIFPYTLRLIYFIRKYRISLIHINNDPLTNMAGVVASKILNVPCVCHVRGSIGDSRVTETLLKVIRHFLPVSRYIYDDLKRFNIPDEKVTIVKEGIELTGFPDRDRDMIRKELNISADAPLIGIAGVLIEWKGQSTVIDSMQTVLNRFPECRLLVIGEAPAGSSAYREELVKKVKETGLSDDVYFLGYRSDVIEIMHELDLLIHASILPEPFGRVIIEGMALGKPVIATAIGGPLEIIQHNKNGVLIPPGDPVSLASAICRLLEDKKLSMELGAQAKRDAAQYSIEAHARLIEDMYEKIIDAENIG